MLYNNEDILYLLWIHNINGIGPKIRKKLMNSGCSLKELFYCNVNELIELGLDEKTVNILINNRNIDLVKRYYEELNARNIILLYPGHKNYPKNLLQLYDAPDLLYAKGQIENINKNLSLAIIGSRQPDDYGREMCRFFTRKLSEKLTIVSGLARGIDSIAHKTCIESNGFTIAVLGCGINVTYPPESYPLYEKIINSGVILSEYGLDVKPLAGYFPQRNRLISGISEGVLVVEARQKSGTLITTDFALEQGKQVYAIPGRISDVLCEGTNELIVQGAMCVTSPNDILQDVGVSQIDETSMNDSLLNQIEVNKNSLAPLEKIVYSCLRLSPVYLDDIVNATKIGVSKTISILYKLEEKGLVRQTLKGFYVITA